jgi:hypothetical protein
MKCPGCGYHIQSKTMTVCKLCGSDLTGGGGHGGHGKAAAAPALERPSKKIDKPEWQRHMLLRVGAPPLELKVGEKFTIGRVVEANLSVPSPRVSRQHAEIIWRDGKAVLKDLGSQNGTTVNGNKVSGEHVLADHDELGIGPYTCSYRCMSGYGSVGKMQGGALDTALTTMAMMGDSLTGQLSQTSLFQVLQMLEVGQKTGQVNVLYEDQNGLVILEEGRIIHASVGDVSGAPALHVMLGWNDGMFRFGTKIDGDPAQNMPGQATILMIEAARVGAGGT